MTPARTAVSTILCLSALLLLSACGTKLISTSDNLIVIQARERDRAEALELAETQCQQRGLRARLTRRVAENQLGFECVR
jgi:ABC-type metal ion transport system substrate-binding protein